MNPPDPILLHHQLCDEIHACVFEENRFLCQHQRAPDPALFERKRLLLSRLDESLASLRAIPAASARSADARAQLEKTRSRILQILQLDKENEELLLRYSLSTPRPMSATPITPSVAMLQKIYARCS